MKRTRMMVTTLAMAMMALGSTTAFAAEKTQMPQAEYVQQAEKDSISVALKKFSPDDMLKVKDGTVLNLSEEMEGDCKVKAVLTDAEWKQAGNLLKLANLLADETDGQPIMWKVKAMQDMALKASDQILTDGEEVVLKTTDGNKVMLQIAKMADLVQNQ